MAKVKILIKGYAKKIEKGWLASSSVVFVEDSGKKIIIDPGCNRQKLIEKLSEIGLTTTDIDFVLLTHSHTDHALLAGIFENAKVLNNEEIYDNDKQIEYGDKIPGTDLVIIQAPGHTVDHCSLLAKTNEGTYVVAGDVFWWSDDEEQKVEIDKPDQAHPADMSELMESRKKLLEIADYIIPGHGEMFKVEK